MPSPRDYHDRYARCIANGCSATLAEMLATRTFPGVKGTDRAFMEGTHAREDTAEVAAYRRAAEAAGVSTAGKRYVGTLADRPGDVRAWVSGLDDVRAVLRDRGWGARGAIEVARPGAGSEAPPARVPIAPDIVAEGVRARLREDPEADPQAVAEQLTAVWSGAVEPESEARVGYIPPESEQAPGG